MSTPRALDYQTLYRLAVDVHRAANEEREERARLESATGLHANAQARHARAREALDEFLAKHVKGGPA